MLLTLHVLVGFHQPLLPHQFVRAEVDGGLTLNISQSHERRYSTYLPHPLIQLLMHESLFADDSGTAKTKLNTYKKTPKLRNIHLVWPGNRFEISSANTFTVYKCTINVKKATNKHKKS